MAGFSNVDETKPDIYNDIATHIPDWEQKRRLRLKRTQLEDLWALLRGGKPVPDDYHAGHLRHAIVGMAARLTDEPVPNIDRYLTESATDVPPMTKGHAKLVRRLVQYHVHQQREAVVETKEAHDDDVSIDPTKNPLNDIARAVTEGDE